MVAERVLRLIQPVRLRAEVVHGFGRGSRQLGFPTANLKILWDADPSSLNEEERMVREFAESHDTGIYCAFGCLEEPVGQRQVYKVAMSMGWNPTFSDVKAKTIEPWILHTFSEDFYGCHLRLLVLAYVRPELKFGSLEELKQEIAADGSFCEAALASPELARFQNDDFLRPWPQPSSKPLGQRAVGSAASVRQLAVPDGIPVGSRLQDAVEELPTLTPDFCRVLLVRHGETVANRQGLLCGGGNDSELNADGFEQACEVGRELGLLLAGSLDLLGSSPLRRALDSADAIAKHFPQAKRVVLDDLKEMAYGTLEGARIADVGGEMAIVAQQWRDGATEARVGGDCGESPQDLSARVLKALRVLLDGQHGRTILLVGHSWVNKVVIAAVTPGLELRRLLDVPQRNCAVNIMDFDCNAPLEDLRCYVRGIDLVAGSRVASARM